MSSAPTGDPHTAHQVAIQQLRRGHRAPMVTWLRRHLFEQVLPFWQRHAVDTSGGLLTCLSDAGAVLSPDKWLWSQWRAVWVFARIFNRIDRDPRWLDYARQIADFCARHGWDEKADGWALLVAQDGRILRGWESTYVDAFAVYALSELYRATNDATHAQLARRTADATLRRLAGPYDRIAHFPYPIPAGAKPHGIPMLWSLSLAELADAGGDERYRARARQLSAEVFRDFYRPEYDMIVEWSGTDGRPIAGPQGDAVVPGHVIEDMWFQIHVAELIGAPVDVAECVRLLQRHLDLGWDTEFGGLRLAIDARGRTEVSWAFAETKLWWPHTEALYASLLGFTAMQNETCLDWYERVWQLCLEHYVDWKNGEWRQKLDRRLQPLKDVVALPVKDPFHLPRSLILQIELLEAAERRGALDDARAPASRGPDRGK